MTASAEIIVVGAGPAGLSLAGALAAGGVRVLVLEQQGRPAIEDPADDGREIALTHRARDIMVRQGLWDAVPADRVSPLAEARVVDGSSPLTLHFASAPRSQGEPLGWLVPNHCIRRAAWQVAQARAGVQVECGATVARLQRDANRAVVELADGRRFCAPLVVAADTRFSALRRMAGIGAAMHDFARTVVVAAVGHDRPHQGTAWECFRYGNTLALLPMPGRQVSAVVTVPTPLAAEWLALSDPDFASRIEVQAEGRLGRMHSAGPRHAYPLVATYAHRFVADRIALVGDAAVGMHPVTAHGWNFGLYGIEVLSREILDARRASPAGDLTAALARYEREHRRATLPVWVGTNGIVTLFTDERPLPRLARRAVLAAAEQAPLLSHWVKSGIRQQLTGKPWRAGPKATAQATPQRLAARP